MKNKKIEKISKICLPLKPFSALTHDFCGALQRFEKDVVSDETRTRLPIVNQLGKLDEDSWTDGRADKLLHLTLVFNREHQRATRRIDFLELTTEVFREQKQKFLLRTQ